MLVLGLRSDESIFLIVFYAIPLNALLVFAFAEIDLLLDPPHSSLIFLVISPVYSIESINHLISIFPAIE